ncbi:hypothetical protein GSM54_26645 [Escherichia coli]|nr:hypothetical protein [Escherichia coli]
MSKPTSSKPARKLSKKAATKRWLKTPAGQRYLAQKAQEQLDRELLHQMAAWL